MIERYPKGYGKKHERKALTRGDRRTDDARVAGGLEVPKPSPHPGKKDTKRWCRGKVGTPHDTHWIKEFDITMRGHESSWWTLTCRACGKQIRMVKTTLGRAPE